MIQSPRQPAQVVEAMSRVKRGGATFITNFYATPERIGALVTSGRLSLLHSNECLLLFRKDQDFLHVHYYARDLQALDAALGRLNAGMLPRTPLTVDLVGRESDLHEVKRVFLTQGYSEYKSLFRMTRLQDPNAVEMFGDTNITFARPEDGRAIHQFLAEQLDKFAEQLPEPEEIQTAVTKCNILLARRGEVFGGILFFETTGLSTVLRYWFVNPEFHSQGIGSRLIKTFFYLCKDSRRVTLWVISDNNNAINKYKHYGFRQDPMWTLVLVKHTGASNE